MHATIEIYDGKYNFLGLFKRRMPFWESGENGLNMYQKEGLILLLEIKDDQYIDRCMSYNICVYMYMFANI